MSGSLYRLCGATLSPRNCRMVQDHSRLAKWALVVLAESSSGVLEVCTRPGQVAGVIDRTRAGEVDSFVGLFARGGTTGLFGGINTTGAGEVVNAVVFLPDSKTPNGVAEAPLTEVALSAFKNQLKFPVPARFKQDSPTGYQMPFKKV